MVCAPWLPADQSNAVETTAKANSQLAGMGVMKQLRQEFMSQQRHPGHVAEADSTYAFTTCTELCVSIFMKMAR